MKYIIDEEQLNEHIFLKLTYWLKASSQLDDIIVNRGKCADDITESFLKSKSPVEEIADEEVRRAINWIKDLGEEKYKIYIEVIK